MRQHVDFDQRVVNKPDPRPDRCLALSTVNHNFSFNYVLELVPVVKAIFPATVVIGLAHFNPGRCFVKFAARTFFHTPSVSFDDVDIISD